MSGPARSPAVNHSFAVARRRGVGVIVLVSAATACGIDQPTAARVAPHVSFAKPVAGAVTVTSTNPDSAYQGDSLVSVRVFGTGFTQGARATWVLAGDTTHVHTSSTSYVSSTEVVAVIKVDPDAPAAFYDIAVALVDGKKGVGAELFAVKVKNNVEQTTRARFSFADSINVGTTAVPVWVAAGIRGDDRLRDGTSSLPGGLSNEYQGNFCSMDAVIGSGIAPEGAQFFSDPDRYASLSLPASCQPARSYRFYVNGPTQPPGVAHPSNIVGNIALMAVGETHVQSFQSGTMSELGMGLWFDDAYPPASSVLVTRLPNVIDEFGRSVKQWRVETRGSHKAVAVVPNSGKKPGSTVTSTFYYMPWAMTITAVPYPFPTYP